MSKVLVVAEHDGSVLNPSVAKVVACAASIDSAEIEVVVLASNVGAIAQEAAQLEHVSRVLTIERPENDYAIAAVLAPQIVAMCSNYTHVFGPSSTYGKDVMPQVAALLGVNQVSDIMAVIDSHTFKRPVYAGSGLATVETPTDNIVIGTVRIASYSSVAEGNSASIESVDVSVDLPTHTRFIELKSGASDRPDLQTSAKDEVQVGQTGKIIAPDLYIAIGISGAIQHLTGIKDAGTIVAINKDEEAPIFEVADIGLVADLFNAVPELTEALD